MSKGITLGGIFTVIILIMILGQIPSGDVTDSKSAIKNAQQGLATDTTIDAGGQVINELSNQAVDNACKDPNSASCYNTKNSTGLVTLAWMIVVLAVIIDGLVGFTKWIVRTVEFIVNIF